MAKIKKSGIVILVAAINISLAMAEEVKPALMTKAHPPIICDGADIVPKKRTKVEFEYLYSKKNRFIKGTAPAPNPTKKEVTIHQGLLRVYYGVFDDFHVVASIPYFDRKLETSTSDKEAAGIGDLELLAKYRFIKESKGLSPLSLAMAGGVKFPTGKDDSEADGFLVPATLQPSSGSFDGIFILFATKKVSSLFIHANAKYQLCSKDSQDYEGGYKINYNAALVYPVADYFDIELEINGSYSERDRQYGIKLENTGGHELYVSPGIIVNMPSSLRFELAIMISVCRNLYGTQNAADAKAFLGASYVF